MFSGYTVVTVVMKASFNCQNKPKDTSVQQNCIHSKSNCGAINYHYQANFNKQAL